MKTRWLIPILLLFSILISSCLNYPSEPCEESLGSVPIISTLPPPSQDKPFRQGSYHCYPDEGCCREYGLLTNDCIPMGGVA